MTEVEALKVLFIFLRWVAKLALATFIFFTIKGIIKLVRIAKSELKQWGS